MSGVIQHNREGGTAVVVGGGFGGLAAAVRLQAAGVQTTLVERRPRLGGRAYQLVDSGYTFDMGPSLITAPAILDSVFRAAGSRLEDHLDLIPLDPYYRIFFHDDTHIDYVGDTERMKDQMRRFDPRDADRLDAFMEKIRPIHDAVITDRQGGRPFDTVGRMAGFLPRILRLGAYWPVATLVNRYFRDFRHRFMYSFHPLFVGGNPFTAPSVYLMIPYLEREGGVWFTPGGMYAVIEALGRQLKALGGRVLTNTEVLEIRIRDGKAVGVETSGGRLDADLVVSNADVGHTYGTLVRPTERRRWTDARLSRLHHTMSCFLLYLGVRRQYPKLAHHTLILSERYRELVRDIFRRKVLADDFSMYLHAPTRTDPSMAPPGCESLYVLIPVPNNESGLDWEDLREGFAERVLTFLEDWGLEGLRDAIEVMRLFTPDDFETELHATAGNAFGVEPRITQTAYLRPHNRSEDVAGLYLVGAGTHPGAGVPGVLLSAEATYACIAEDWGLPPAPDAHLPGQVALEPGSRRSLGDADRRATA